MTYSLQIHDLSPEQIRSVAYVMENNGVPLGEYEQLGIAPIIEAGQEDESGKTPDRLIGFEPYCKANGG